MSDEQKQLSKARQALVDRVLSRLDAGEILWDNGMQGIAEKPYNAITCKPYRGMNVLNLMLSFKQDPRWLTFNQAKDKGYTVKKGAKGVPIELYKIIDRRTKKDADLDAIREETKDMTFEERQEFKRKNLQSFAQSYYVFNASDVHGIEPYVPKEPTPADITARNERIERVIADSEARIYYDGNGRNYYDPTVDQIHLTDRTSFKSDEFFYNTALHEMAHSTGHSSRLNRSGGSYGTEAYAQEELVAEMSSVLTAAEFGLNHSDRVIENSAEYVRSWARLIRDNPQTLIDAAFDASRATDYICDAERKRERVQEKTQKESLQSSVKEWYSRQYPTDELASTLNEKATFGTVRDALMSGKDVYSELGNDDSVVRERVFGKFADILDVSNKAVYDAWIENSESTDTRRERQRQTAMQDFPKDFADDGLLDAAEDFAKHTPKYDEKTQKESSSDIMPQPPKKPYEFKTNLANIPDAMKALPNWVAFRTKQVDGKVKKILLNPNKGASSVEYLKWAKANDPDTWAAFDKAKAFAKKYKLDGLAFAMSGSGMTCIDLDHHIDENGKPSEIAQKYINAAQGTYIEKSVSGRGLHIFYAGSRPGDRQNRNIELDLETYDSARFMSMTGNLYGDTPKAVNTPSAELRNLLASHLAKLQQYSAPSVPLGMDDNALIDKIRNSKSGRDFEALWRGEDICGDHSVSDFKLCNMLAFFSGGDAAQVERCFRSSGLYRPQKGDAYVKRTAEKACATLTKRYEPRAFMPKQTSGKPSGSGGR